MRTACSVALALFATSCVSYRQVTPWLRTSRYEPPDVICAVSGGSHCSASTTTERRLDGEWVRMERASDYALPFARGTRVALDRRILREDGHDVEVTCEGHLRAAPDADELFCIDLVERDLGDPTVADITRVDRDGFVRDVRRVTLPVVLGEEGAPPIEGHGLSTHVLGFLDQALVFSVFVADYGESFANDAPKHCTAYLLGPGDRWHELAVLRFTTSEIWICKAPEVWNARLDLGLEPGFADDSAGGGVATLP
jgi:hypothetical protein